VVATVQDAIRFPAGYERQLNERIAGTTGEEGTDDESGEEPESE
jgi:hypothetical protein